MSAITMDTVRDLIERHSDHISGNTREFCNGAYAEIADELNAALGDDGYKQAAEYWKGMYEELLTERIGEDHDYPEHDGRYECPDCGNVVYYDELYGGGWTIYVEDYQIRVNHCPKCGKAVKR